jgi:uncharacterized membrane protein HdeD (DUF308 family)
MAEPPLVARYRKRVKTSYFLAVLGIPLVSFGPFAFAFGSQASSVTSAIASNLGAVMLTAGILLLFASLSMRLNAFMEHYGVLGEKEMNNS